VLNADRDWLDVSLDDAGVSAAVSPIIAMQPIWKAALSPQARVGSTHASHALHVVVPQSSRWR
jgi:hypothetical protein